MLNSKSVQTLACVLTVWLSALLASAPGSAFAQQAQDLQSEMQLLKESYQYLRDRIEFLSYLAGAIGFFSVAGLGLWVFGEFRSQKSISSINELFELAARTARDAAGASLRQAREWLNDIEDEAVKFLEGEGKGDRNFVRTHAEKSQLARISDDVRAYRRFVRHSWGRGEGVRKGAKRKDDDAAPPPLTVRCHFILALSENLAQDYGAAIKAFVDGARQAGQEEAGLAARCYYWAGMVSNNIGRFKDAQDCYVQAQGRVQKDRDRYWEFERLRLESWHFENWRKPVEDIEQAVESVENRARGRNIGANLREPALVMCANVLLAAALARELSDPAQGRLLDKACRLFGSNQDRWARFGLAQTLWRRNGAGDRARAGEIYADILPGVIDELTRRFEDRQKILFRATAFVCHCRLGRKEEARDEQSVMIAALGDIEENSYLYSQVAMRNVKKDEFKAALRRFFDEHFP